MNNRGRKVKYYPAEEIDLILYNFRKKNNNIGLIKYLEVYRFAKEMYLNDEIKYKLSEDFWRKEGRQGRRAIDDINSLYRSTIKGKSEELDYYVDTELYIDKLFKASREERKILVDALKINEKKAKEHGQLLGKITLLKAELENTKLKLNEEKARSEEYRKLLFSWFNSSNKRELGIENFTTTGKSRSKLVNLFFESMFSDPNEAYYQLNKSVANPMVESDRSVVPIKKSRIQNMIDKYDV